MNEAMARSFSRAGIVWRVDLADQLDHHVPALEEQRVEHRVLGAEVVVDEPVGHARLLGDVRHPALGEALLGEHPDRRVEDLPPFVDLRRHRPPPLTDWSVKIPAMQDRPQPVPPARMPLWRGGRPLKRWRYLGVYGADLLCCFGQVTIAGLPQAFWAVWDRETRVLRERTRLRAGAVRLENGLVRVRDRGVAIDLTFAPGGEDAAVEVVSPHGGSYVWTRKRAGVPIAGSVLIDGVARSLVARGVVDDSAGYHARHTAWCWSAGVGSARDGRDVAWNLVTGIHDSATGSERAVWVDGVATEAPPVRFDEALTEVAALDGSFALRCAVEAVREREDHLGPLRSTYAQPFGTFAGTLPGGLVLERGFGVMERHSAAW